MVYREKQTIAMDNEPQTIQCSRCKKRFFEAGFKINRLGRRLKTCLECNARQVADQQRYKCAHGRQRSKCRDCGGSQFCAHDRRRHRCRDCGGASVCAHNRVRDKCRECGGASICPHGRERYSCRDCGGSSICPHNRQRNKCRECGGSQFCPHNRERNTCRECGGASICAHGRLRRHCRECDPAGYLRQLVSNRVRKAISDDKNRGSIEYLGCSIEEFKTHIESTFEPGMSWENHGRVNVDGQRVWNIDHVVPIKFETVPGVPPTLEEVIARLHWTNTQAMWAVDNIAKGNRFVGRALPQEAAPEAPKLTDADIDELLAGLTL